METPWLDGRHVIFGQLDNASLLVLQKIEGCGSISGRTTVPVVIADCGEL